MLSGWRARNLAAVVCASLAAITACASPAGAITRMIPPASGCTNPAAPPGTLPYGRGLDPSQLAAAYDVAPMWNAGYRGQGTNVALIMMFGDALDTAGFGRLSDCYGPFATPTQEPVPSGTPTVPGGEGALDPLEVAAMAPSTHIFMFESPTADGVANAAPLLKAALNPANTGGKLVNAISISYGHCEFGFTTQQVNSVERQLRLAASLNVPVFVSSGDEGSTGTIVVNGIKQCIPNGTVDTSAVTSAKAGLSFPGSSPFVTSVGGTEFTIDHHFFVAGDAAGGTLTNEFVWNEGDLNCPNAIDLCTTIKHVRFAGGGGFSSLFTVADAPWEGDVGITGAESKPDITALADSPGPLPAVGTSASSPMMAGAVATLDSYLAGHGAAPLGMLNPTLYEIATRPSVSASVFNDVTSGNNAIVANLKSAHKFHAHAGYDQASGLGSLNLRALGDAILSNRSLRVPWTTLALTGAAPSPGIEATVTATTNNVLAGTPFVLAIFSAGHLLKTCSSSPCSASVVPDGPFPAHVEFRADVGPSSARPFGPTALASKKVTVTIQRRTQFGCPPGGRIGPFGRRSIRASWQRRPTPPVAVLAKCPVNPRP
jgi:subtilase family serine protease